MKAENDVYGIKIFDGIKNDKPYTIVYPSAPSDESQIEIKTYFNIGRNNINHIDGKIKICEHGFHFSPSYDDARHDKGSLITPLQYDFVYIPPVYQVKAPKGSEIDTIPTFTTLGRLRAENKIATSDLEIISPIPYTLILHHLSRDRRVFGDDEVINHKNNTILLDNTYSQNWYFLRYDTIDIENIIFEPTILCNRKTNNTLFIDHDLIEIGTRMSYIIITNKTKYTQYVNIVDRYYQYIFNIPRHSEIKIDKDITKSNKPPFKIIQLPY